MAPACGSGHTFPGDLDEADAAERLADKPPAPDPVANAACRRGQVRVRARR